MPRKKSVKHAKKRQTSSTTNVNLVKIEKDWKKVPAQMATLINKQVKANKKNESKLQKDVTKFDKLVQKTEVKIAKANNHKNPAIAKKQLRIEEKNLAQYTKALNRLNKELEAASQAYATSQEKQAMYAALNKHVDAFESEWKKSQIAAKKTAKAKIKKSKAAKASKAKTAETSIQPVEMDDQIETVIAEVA